MDFTKSMDKLKKFKITGRGIYFFSFISYFLISFIRTSTYTSVISSNQLVRLTYLIILILLIKIYYFDSKNAKEYLINTLVILIGIIVWRSAHAVDIFMYLLLVIGAKNINYNAVIEWYFKIGTIILVFIILSSSLGIIQDLVFFRDGIARHSLGILYPTDFAAHTFFLLLAYCYLYFKKLTWKSYISFILIAAFLMLETQARLDVIAILLTIPIMWLAKRASEGKIFSQFFASFYWLVTPILAYITAIVAYFYNGNKFYMLADKIVSGRLKLSHTAFNRYGVSLFGNFVHEQGFGGSAGSKTFYQSGMEGKYFFIDSSFIRLIIIYGLIAFLVVITVMTVIGINSTLKNEYRLAAIMVLLAISCVVEQHLLDISYDPFLIAILASGLVNSTNNNQITTTTEV